MCWSHCLVWAPASSTPHAPIPCFPPAMQAPALEAEYKRLKADREGLAALRRGIAELTAEGQAVGACGASRRRRLCGWVAPTCCLLRSSCCQMGVVPHQQPALIVKHLPCLLVQFHSAVL